MLIDLSQFYEVFFEESLEGLEIIESGLMQLNVGEFEGESINTIFRAAHSIKGSASMFGFTRVANFTHVLEALLDEIRSKKREVTHEVIDTLFLAVDIVRELLNSEDGSDDCARREEIQNKLQALLSAERQQKSKAFLSKTTYRPRVEYKPIVDDVNDARLIRVWEIEFLNQTEHEGEEKLDNQLIQKLELLGNITIKNKPSDEQDDVDPHADGKLVLLSDCLQDQIEEILKEYFNKDEWNITCRGAAQIGEAETAILEKTIQPKMEPVPEREPVFSVIDEREKLIDVDITFKEREKQSVRVGITKLDNLVDMVGELVITQSMLSKLSDEFSLDKLQILQDGIELLERNTRDLQESVLQLRMLPISFSFNRFPRLVRDLAKELGKKVELEMFGTQTEVDKTIMELLADPLTHFVRNALDHGIEKPQDRRDVGKPETATIQLKAYNESSKIIIQVSDDGIGLDKEQILNKALKQGLINDLTMINDEKIHELIFLPGFTTVDEVSDLSGRGVGLDVVNQNINKLGGNIKVISTRGQGTVFTISLPLTTAIVDGQITRVGEQIYIIPLITIVESIQSKKEDYKKLAGTAELYRYRGEYIPLLRLYELFSIEQNNREIRNEIVVIVETGVEKIAILIDELHGQQQFVSKNIETNYQKVDGVSAVTILADGTAAMILDPAGLLQISKNSVCRIETSSNKTEKVFV